MKERFPAPVSAVPAYDIQEINVREYLLVLMKRRRTVAAILILSFLLAALYSFLQTPVYKSFTRINIDPITSTVIPGVIPKESSQINLFMVTQYQLLRSRTIAKRLQEKLNLDPSDLVPAKDKEEVKKQWATRNPVDRANFAIDQVMQMIDVTAVRDTTLFIITFLTPDPNLSKTLADGWANAYIEYSLASQSEYSRKARILLAEQIKNLQNDIKEKRQLLQDFSSEKQVILIGAGNTSIVASKLEDINRDLSAATSDRIAKEVAYRDLLNHGKYAQPEVRNNPIIIGLKEQYTALERQYSEKTSLFLPDYPVMQSLRKQMDDINVAIEKEASDIFAKVLSNAKADYDEAAKKESALKAEVDRVKGDTIRASQQEFNYDQLKMELADKQKSLEVLLTRQTEADATAQAQEMKAITIRIIDEAQVPKRPDKPDIPYNFAIFLGIGLLFAICIAFISDYFDRSFKNLDDVHRHLDLPFLGIIPTYHLNGNGHEASTALMKSESDVSGESIDLLTLYDPQSIHSEAFRTLRASLLVSFPQNPPRTILVTSSQAGEGKTFVASNLAVTLAQLDKKVVLLDADMRNPRLHTVWNLSNDTGLTQFLTTDISSSIVTRPTRCDGLYVITSGTRTPRPAELLSSKRLDELLLELQREFDHIIIDTPPVMPVSDSLVLAAKCNCVILVVRAGVTHREVVHMASERLIRFDATMAGAILNGAEPYFNTNYYSSYGKYYEDKQPPKILKHLTS